jgi:hypothetical protein
LIVFSYHLGRFKLSATYPKSPASVEIESSNGLNKEELGKLAKIIENVGKENANKIMCHEIALAIQSFLESRHYVPEILYDAMIRREQEKSAFIENLKKHLK